MQDLKDLLEQLAQGELPTDTPVAKVSFDGPGEGMDVTPTTADRAPATAGVGPVADPKEYEQALAGFSKTADPQPAPAATSAPAPKAYDFAAELADARAEDRRAARQALRGEAFDQLAKAFSGGLTAEDKAYWDAAAKAGQGNVEDVKATRDAVSKTIEDRLKEQQVKKGEADAALRDPQSPQSRAFQGVVKSLYGDKISDDDLKYVSAADREVVMEPLKLMETIEARKQQYRLQASLRDSQLQERQDFRAHQATLGKLRGDKQLVESANRATNLSNALSNYDKLGVVTPQDLADLQALTISNMGVQGGGSAHERAERYAKSLGIDAKSTLQFLTGNPQDIGKDHPIYQRFGDIAKMEVQNFRNRAAQRVNALTAGNKSVYSRRPDLKADLDDAVAAQLGQLPSAGTSPEDEQAIAWAKANPNDPRARKILSLHGM